MCRHLLIERFWLRPTSNALHLSLSLSRSRSLSLSLPHKILFLFLSLLQHRNLQKSTDLNCKALIAIVSSLSLPLSRSSLPQSLSMINRLPDLLLPLSLHHESYNIENWNALDQRCCCCNIRHRNNFSGDQLTSHSRKKLSIAEISPLSGTRSGRISRN